MQVINIFVDFFRLNPDTITVGTKGSYGNYKLNFEFSQEWDALTRKISFYPPGHKPISVVLLNAKIDIPYECYLNSGDVKFVISGMDGMRTVITLIGYIRVQHTLEPTVTPAGSPTQSEISQIYGYMQEAINTANDVKRRADDGEFDGTDGMDGEDGLPGQRGTLWYNGTAITGTSLLPLAYPTGIDNAQVGDLYFNILLGYAYVCVLGGDETTALWKWVANVGGSSGAIVSSEVNIIWVGTQAEYDALQPDATTLYFITG